MLGDEGPVPIGDRLSHAGYGSRGNAYGPDPGPARPASRSPATNSPARPAPSWSRFWATTARLQGQLEQAGVPWTPGSRRLRRVADPGRAMPRSRGAIGRCAPGEPGAF